MSDPFELGEQILELFHQPDQSHKLDGLLYRRERMISHVYGSNLSLADLSRLRQQNQQLIGACRQRMEQLQSVEGAEDPLAGREPQELEC